jgi:hypothetical protein
VTLNAPANFGNVNKMFDTSPRRRNRCPVAKLTPDEVKRLEAHYLPHAVTVSNKPRRLSVSLGYFRTQVRVRGSNA